MSFVPVPLPTSRGYWRYQSLGSFSLSYVGDSHAEPFVAVMRGVAKFGLANSSASSFNPMAYLKKCQTARIIYSTSSTPPEDEGNEQPFTSIGIDSFNNPYSVDEASQTMTVTFEVKVSFSNSSNKPRISFGFACPPVSPLVKTDRSTLLKLLDIEEPSY